MVLCIAFLALAGAGRRRRWFVPGIVPVRVDQLIATRFARGRLVGAVGVRSLLERLRPRHRGEDGRTAGMPGRANHRVSHGRLSPKGLYGWKANNAPDRLTTSLGVCNGSCRALQTAESRKGESMRGRLRCVLAGSSAALVWAAQEPVDRRLFGCDYSDVAVLGKAVTRGRHWRTTGLAVHAVNGALFGLAYYEARRSLPIEGRRLAMAMALTEHALLYPLCFFIDRFHPARGQEGVPPLLTNPRAFGQATWRHAIFGVILGRLA